MDFIRDQQLNFHLGNAIKYICRAGFKEGATKEKDLTKAIVYIQDELAHAKRERVQESVRNSQLPGASQFTVDFDR